MMTEDDGYLQGLDGPRRGTAYCCGFAFNADQSVVLIEKRRPAWQAGLLNGVGGKIEELEGETAVEAMEREFAEEANVRIPAKRWTKFHVERWPNGNSVHFFAVLLSPEERKRLASLTEERLRVIQWKHRTYHNWGDSLYNLGYLVPMAFCHLTGNPANIPAHAE